MLLNKEVYFPIKIFTTTAALLLTDDTVVFSPRKCTIQPNKRKPILIPPVLGEREIYKKILFSPESFPTSHRDLLLKFLKALRPIPETLYY